jgi:hypothetical protein
MGQTLSPSKSVKSLLNLIGVKSGTSGNTRGSFSGGTAGFTNTATTTPVVPTGIKRNKQSSKPVSFKLPADNYKSVVGGKVKMKELTGTNTTGVQRNRTTKSSPITSSILNWWKQKGIDTQSQSNKNFMKAQKTLPKNFGRGSY